MRSVIFWSVCVCVEGKFNCLVVPVCVVRFQCSMQYVKSFLCAGSCQQHLGIVAESADTRGINLNRPLEKLLRPVILLTDGM